MTLGRREYSEADMIRMQRDAEERVREMQDRARQTVEQGGGNMPQRNRNWNSGSNIRRQNRRNQQDSHQQQESRQNQPPPAPEPPPPPENSAPEAEKKQTTIVEDIMGTLKLDEDYLLIIGLILLLVNQRADTTLILALAYLLI